MTENNESILTPLPKINGKYLFGLNNFKDVEEEPSVKHRVMYLSVLSHFSTHENTSKLFEDRLFWLLNGTEIKIEKYKIWNLLGHHFVLQAFQSRSPQYNFEQAEDCYKKAFDLYKNEYIEGNKMLLPLIKKALGIEE